MLRNYKYLNWNKISKALSVFAVVAVLFLLSFLLSFNLIGRSATPRISCTDADIKVENTDLKEKNMRLQEQLDEANAELDRLRALSSHAVPSASSRPSNVFPAPPKPSLRPVVPSPTPPQATVNVEQDVQAVPQPSNNAPIDVATPEHLVPSPAATSVEVGDSDGSSADTKPVDGHE